MKKTVVGVASGWNMETVVVDVRRLGQRVTETNSKMVAGPRFDDWSRHPAVERVQVRLPSCHLDPLLPSLQIELDGAALLGRVGGWVGQSPHHAGECPSGFQEFATAVLKHHAPCTMRSVQQSIEATRMPEPLAFERIDGLLHP